MAETQYVAVLSATLHECGATDTIHTSIVEYDKDWHAILSVHLASCKNKRMSPLIRPH
jgi:hypothetical protein